MDPLTTVSRPTADDGGGTEKGRAKRPATLAEARALSHPLRLRILRLCLDEAMTNRQLADRLGEQPATILFHVRTLVREGFLVREPERRGRRGARELPYRSTRKSLTLEFGLEDGGQLAMIDALRAELAEVGPAGVLTLSRIAFRADAARLAAMISTVDGLVADATSGDDPAGEPVAIFVTLHRRS